MAGTPRIDALWEDELDDSDDQERNRLGHGHGGRMAYFDRGDEEERAGLVANGGGGEGDGGEGEHSSNHDLRTPLDKTIDRIGMGACFLSHPLRTL